MLENKDVGDYVHVDGYTSMAQQNFRKTLIIGVDYKFDPDTGDKFKIIQIDNGEWFDSRNGGCYSNENSMYYIEQLFSQVAERQTLYNGSVMWNNYPQNCFTLKKDFKNRLQTNTGSNPVLTTKKRFGKLKY